MQEPTPFRILYLVQNIYWIRSKEGLPSPFEGKPIRAFANRAAAEAYRRVLEHNARNEPRVRRRDDYHFTIFPDQDQAFEFQFFEVIEMEWRDE